MHFSSVVVALGAFASLSSAAALDADTELDAFSVDQVDSGRARRTVLHSMRDAFIKHNGSAPAAIEAAFARQVKGSVGAHPEPFDKEYLVPVKIGTPSKTLMMILDTGSSDFWTFSGALPAGQRKGHTSYYPTKSKTSHKLRGYTWNIKYGDGSSAGGKVFKDKAKIAGITVAQQAVEVASRVAPSFAADKLEDGIVGFGFSNLNSVKPKKQRTFFGNISGRLRQHVFCADLKHHKAGSYDIGFINPNKHKGPIHYAGVRSGSGVFFFRAGGFLVGGKKRGGSFQAIADTGTSVMLVNNNIVRAYYSRVKGAAFDNTFKQYVFPCNAKLPGFSIIVGGSARHVPPSFINYGFDRVVRGKRYCVGGIQSNNGLGVAVLGDVFLKSQYVVFDYARKRVGFADK